VTGRQGLLVVGPSWVGDMVMANALFRDIAARDPAVAIDVLAPAWSLPILARMTEVRRGIALPVGHGELGLGKRLAVARDLRAANYRQAIVLPRSLKAALVPFLARIPRRTGFRGEYRYGLINDMRPFDPQVLDQTVKRFRFLGLGAAEDELPPLQVPVLRVDIDSRLRLIRDLGLSASEPVVALMPGAEYGPAKQWPVGHFRALAADLAGRGLGVWVFGSAREAALGERIVAALPGAVNLCGRTSLPDVVDLVSAAAAVVSNDSGLMHLAAACGVHVTGIYGSSSPSFTPPLTADSSVVYRSLECSPCFARQCPLGHTDCLVGIAPAEVAQRVLDRIG